jgi:hypothetical protein
LSRRQKYEIDLILELAEAEAVEIGDDVLQRISSGLGGPCVVISALSWGFAILVVLARP